MASIVTCIATSVTWCFCTATASLLGACCGNDKPSTLAPGPTSGRKRSVFVLFLAVALSIAYQFGIAKFVVDTSLSNFVLKGWLDGCQAFANDKDLQKSCVGNYANYRVSAATTLFFCLAALAAMLKPTANREAWPAKYVLYFFLVGAFSLIPNDPLFKDIYLHIARIGGVFFVFFQQLVILDLAHNWNDSWVEKANKAEAEERGGGKKWLGAILASCVILFLGSITVLIYMFVDFTGCPTNNSFIALTLIFCILLTIAQMSGEEASLLSSGCISAWAVFLCYTAVSNNPDRSCNPKIGHPSRLAIAFGLTVTLMSLCWTGWSYTAEDTLSNNKNSEATVNEAAKEETQTEGKTRAVRGVVTGVTEDTKDEEANKDPKDEQGISSRDADPSLLSNSWKLNIALAAVACWSAVSLTHWGEISSEGTLVNPSVSRVGMWMVIASQWIIMSLYLWTLVAPRLFPGRDFS